MEFLFLKEYRHLGIFLDVGILFAILNKKENRYA
jgi:hypothetical protein